MESVTYKTLYGISMIGVGSSWFVFCTAMLSVVASLIFWLLHGYWYDMTLHGLGFKLLHTGFDGVDILLRKVWGLHIAWVISGVSLAIFGLGIYFHDKAAEIKKRDEGKTA